MIFDINMTGVWIEDLVGCPSQCYYYYIDPLNNEAYCIYLRWRFSDPWEVYLIPCIHNDAGGWNIDFSRDWENIDIEPYSEDEKDKLQEEVINLINLRLPVGHQLENKKEEAK